jgi:predicted nucleic acid-binding protein
MTSHTDSVAHGAAAVALPEGGPALPSRISWGAVLAGGVIAAAIAATLNILGAAIGATTIDAVGRATPDAGSLGIGAVAWLVIANTIALAAGGYTAARLSGSADGTDGLLHGLAVWAIAFLVSATLLGNLVAGAVSTAASTASSVAGSAASSVGSAVSAVAGQPSPEALLQRAQDTLRGTGNAPTAMTTEQRGAEVASLLARRAANGAFTGEERTRLNALVAAESNIPAEEAARRVQSVEEQAQRTAAEAAQRARTAADAAARAASIAAFGGFVALLLGAIAAVLGARRGTRDWVALRAAAPRIAPRAA